MSKKSFSLSNTFSSAWTCYKRFYIKIIGAFFIAYLLPTIIFLNPFGLVHYHLPVEGEEWVFYGLAFLKYFACTYLTLGYSKLLIHLEKGEDVPFSTIFTQWRYLFKYCMLMLLPIIMFGILLLLNISFVHLIYLFLTNLFDMSASTEEISKYCSIFFIMPAYMYLMTRIMLVNAVLLDQNLGPLQCVKESFKLSQGQEWAILVFFFVLIYKYIGGILLVVAGIFIKFLYSNFGLILSGTGIFVILPQAMLTMFSVYRQLKESSERIENAS